MKPQGILLAIGIGAAALVAADGVAAQQADNRPLADFTPLVPPVFPLPPASQVGPGAVGGSQNPYTTAPLQNPTLKQPESAPGLKLTIPVR